MDGRKVTVNKLSRRPPIYEVKKFLTDDECNQLIELANEHGLEVSKTHRGSEELETEKLLEINKFSMWDKDNSGNIEVTEVYGVVFVVRESKDTLGLHVVCAKIMLKILQS